MLAAALLAVGTGAVGEALRPVVVGDPVGTVTDPDVDEVRVENELVSMRRLDETDVEAAVDTLVPMLGA